MSRENAFRVASARDHPLPVGVAGSLAALTLLIVLCGCVRARLASLQGQVTAASGASVAGLFVTARAKENGIEYTVYSAPDGSFAFPDLPHGPYVLTVHHAGVESASQEVVFTGTSSSTTLEVRPSKKGLLSAPTSVWLAALPDGKMKNEFLLNCATCHEFAQARIMPQGKPRDRAGWIQAINRMKAVDVYGIIPHDFNTEGYAAWLAEHLSAEAIEKLAPPTPVTGAYTQGAVITEYPVPQANELPHDLVIGPDGRVWITAFWNSQIWAMDPATGAYEIFEVNNEPGTPAQVRALEFDRTGSLWIVNGGTLSVVRLDVKSKHYDTYKVGMYAHDLVIDSAGDIWINDYFSKSERMARVSHTDGKVTVVPLPTAGLKGRLPLPYGLQVDRKDRLWSTQLAANTLVRYDIGSSEAKLYRMPNPNSGPRRTAVGVDGRIWIPEFTAGRLTSFDPASERFETIDLKDSAAGPYDLAVDPRTGDVWIAESLGGALVRFDPKTKTFERFPLPTEPAYMRHLAIDPKTGDVWSTYSSLPTAVPKIVRLQRKGSEAGTKTH